MIDMNDPGMKQALKLTEEAVQAQADAQRPLTAREALDEAARTCAKLHQHEQMHPTLAQGYEWGVEECVAAIRTLAASPPAETADTRAVALLRRIYDKNSKCEGVNEEVSESDWFLSSLPPNAPQPVAWIHKDAAILKQGKTFHPSLEHQYIPVYAAPVSERATLPEGWVAVPREPTKEMLEAGFGPFLAAHDPLFSKNEPCGPIYRVMLATAPSPTSNAALKQGPGDEESKA